MTKKLISNKLNAGLLVVSMLGTISVFAMDTMSSTTMTHDNMMSATGTVKVSKMMDQMDNGLMMKIDKKSKKEDIIKLQEMLIKNGSLKVKKGTKLGFFGPATEMAFKKYKTMTMKMMEKNKMMGTSTMSTGTMMHQ